eukprot:gnl/MRDRNA2_/MRDRNA2_72102_c0_seq2.p1 gnl/MRDRNA2_/MRDRNA2_72102_c0~~gnl/MRDRNA2_/MRDRNA2_72102_c0_seq2.p1  ORF type:complete len:259 (-),score=39.35 gnl/MRDRNA2_/MRDRNA2_72102_c0_seq2:115-801(-)
MSKESDLDQVVESRSCTTTMEDGLKKSTASSVLQIVEEWFRDAHGTDAAFDSKHQIRLINQVMHEIMHSSAEALDGGKSNTDEEPSTEACDVGHKSLDREGLVGQMLTRKSRKSRTWRTNTTTRMGISAERKKMRRRGIKLKGLWRQHCPMLRNLPCTNPIQPRYHCTTTSIQVNPDMRMHVDARNTGPSEVLSLGKLPTRSCVGFDGNTPHILEHIESLFSSILFSR